MLGTITVHNKYHIDFNCSTSSAESYFYIGRPSVLGNPYIIGKDGTREEVIKKYEEWLREKIEDNNSPQYKFMRQFVLRYAHGKDINLVCFCKPAPCHGDIVKELIEEMCYRS